MCYHVSNNKNQKAIKSRFKKEFENEDAFEPAFHLNGFDKPLLPVISNEDSSLIKMYRWRLIPENVQDESAFLANTLNARADELFTKSSYKNYVQNRCLIVCTGFFEPHKAIGGKTHSYYIQPKKEPFFTLAGIWTQWQGIHTCSIITVDASPLMAEVHNDGKRMPLILDEQMSTDWLQKKLSKEEMTAIMNHKIGDENLTAFRVIDGVMNAQQNTNIAAVIEAYKPTGEQGSLF
ncbi:MAG: SOS response-associated peptidase family protein [Chitinophagaceae bacterium]|nr:SOS response-associated peptidase family protein [Chitinophagaceae bacterium]